MPTMRSMVPALSALALLAAACGGGGGGDQGQGQDTPSPTPTDVETTDGGGGDAVELEVEAEDFAFDASSYTVPAEASIELKFKNRDEGVPHTFTIYESDDAQQQIFGTGNLTGDAEDTFQLQAPAAGTYYFQCDVHPDMNGDLVAE